MGKREYIGNPKTSSPALPIKMWCLERSPKILKTKSDNGEWIKVKKIGKNKWLGKWKWNK